MANFVLRDEFDILDLLTVMNLVIGVSNAERSTTNADLLDHQKLAITRIKEHLSSQDKKLDLIMEKLGVSIDEPQ